MADKHLRIGATVTISGGPQVVVTNLTGEYIEYTYNDAQGNPVYLVRPWSMDSVIQVVT